MSILLDHYGLDAGKRPAKKPPLRRVAAKTKARAEPNADPLWHKYALDGVERKGTRKRKK